MPSVTIRWVGGRREGVGIGGEWGGRRQKLYVKTRGHQSPLDGPDHSTKPKAYHFGQG